MLAALEIVIILAGLILAVPVVVVFLEALMAFPRRRVSGIPECARPRVAVLVPAHNEHLIIGETLASISRQLEAGDRLVVIADNCSDNTADVARQHGAEVTVRFNPDLRGKSYALEWGMRFLEQTAVPEVVVFIDADCQLDDGCIDRLARLSVDAMRPTQAAYLMNPPQPLRQMTALVCFAWTVKDFVRPLGWHRLNLPCQLAGSGMAFPWEVIRAANLASGHLAEDLKLGVELALAGRFTQFCPEAVVRSNVAARGVPSTSQRARWEHGTIDMMARYLPRLLIRFCKNRSLPLLAVALDLSVPPLALLTLALGAHVALALLFLCVTGISLPFLTSSMTCTVFVVAIFLAWLRHGREILPLHWLVVVPFYAIGKVPLYAKFLLSRQREWVKGERELKR